jgi:hypothetical protein
MYATLAQFLRMSPEEQRQVTFLDLSIADDEDLYRHRDKGHDALVQEEKEYIYGRNSQ